MLRREFLVLMAGAGWPAAGLAQSAKTPRIGILALGNPDPAPFLKEFREGLRQLGYVEGQNIAIEFRSANGAPAQLLPLARELVALKVDMIVGFQTPTIIAAKQATTEVPIVMGSAGDPVGNGLVASFARPGGNVTGVAGVNAQMGAKNIELIREIFPNIRRIALLLNAPDPFHKPFGANIEAAGQATGIEIKPLLIKGVNEHDRAFAEIDQARAEAVVIQPSLLNKRVADMALQRRLPAISPHADFPVVGGLLSYSADQPTLFREAATFVDKILKGRKPADLPVQLPTKFLLVVNLKTASALGITLPPTLLTRADRVIE
jgi:putative tryptophan/tyrosine transport system substrate-binding protein